MFLCETFFKISISFFKFIISALIFSKLPLTFPNPHHTNIFSIVSTFTFLTANSLPVLVSRHLNTFPCVPAAMSSPRLKFTGFSNVLTTGTKAFPVSSFPTGSVFCPSFCVFSTETAKVFPEYAQFPVGPPVLMAGNSGWGLRDQWKGTGRGRVKRKRRLWVPGLGRSAYAHFEEFYQARNQKYFIEGVSLTINVTFANSNSECWFSRISFGWRFFRNSFKRTLKRSSLSISTIYDN